MKKILLATIIMLFSITAIQAQKTEVKKNKKEKLYVKIKDGESPIIYVDGKKFDFPMELIDQSKIESISILKKEYALKKFNAPNGVVLIKTKSSKKTEKSTIEIKANQQIGNKNGPKIIIDGKVALKETMDKLNTNDIANIKVIKGEKAIIKYNAPNGVIIITTKKN